MDSAIVLENTLRKAQDILWEAFPPGTSREPTVVKLKELLWSPEISTALAASSDNYFAFAVRESRVFLADASVRPDKIVSTLWAILDDPPLQCCARDSAKLPHEEPPQAQPSLALMRRAKIARADDRRHFLTLLSGAGAALHVGGEPALHCHDREQGDWLSIIAVD